MGMAGFAEGRIPPTNDLMFKKTFASEGNEDITIGLIAADICRR
jgi:hypothetical protein